MHSFLSALKNQRGFRALHYREFRLITGSQLCGNLGTWMDELSRGWLIYQLTDSVVQLGLVRGTTLMLPSVLRLPSGAIVAHWLQKSGADTYAYDVRVAQSMDGGASWSAPRVLHDDGTPVGWLAALTRNVLRAVDFLPVAYGFGLAVMLARPDRVDAETACFGRQLQPLAIGPVVGLAESAMGLEAEGDADFHFSAFTQRPSGYAPNRRWRPPVPARAES